ncbi:MAG: hypothetical protein VKJ86_03500 [Synechococcus sp.]|nr:hypothetical protein [Synechococcus sp.]
MSSSSPHPPVPSTTSRFSVTNWIIALLGRSLVLLGAGAGAIALGVLGGHFMPRANPNPPLFLRLWATKSVPGANLRLNQAIAQLSSEERAAIAQEIAGIQAQLDVLEARTQQLETELDLGFQSVTLGDRLQNLTALLAADPSTFDPTAVPTNDTSDLQPLKITLPSNALFGTDGQLSTDATDILGVIAMDLQQQKPRTIMITSHQPGADSLKSTSLARQQAQAVQTYLAQALPGDYRWLVVGYGEAIPTNATAENNQARIEISTQ